MRPSYFDPTTQPDTETGYRLGGKVNKMQKFSVAKKMPRKFQAGGKATAPALTGMDLERENARRDARVKKEKDAYEAQRPNSLGPRPAEKPEVKKAKGGSIRKFADGGETSSEDKDVSYDMPSEPKPRFGADTYARAQKFLEAGKKSDSVATKATYKPSPKNISTVKVGAKPAPAKPTPAKSSDYGNESRRMTEAPKRAGVIGSFDKKPEDIDVTKYSLAERRAMSSSKKGSRAEDIYPSLVGKKAGGVVKKFAKGGGIEVKGKTRGKVC